MSRLIASGRGDGLRAQLLRRGLGMAALKAISLPLTLLATIMLARGLGPEGFGQYAFVIALITTLSIPIAPALMQFTTRETATMHQVGDGDRIHALLRWGNRLVLVGSALVIVTLGGLVVSVADWRLDDRYTLLLWGVMALPLLGLNAVRSGLLVGLRRVVQGQFPELLVRPLALLLIISALLVADLLSPLTAVVAYVAGTALAFALGIALLRRTLPENKGKSPPKDTLQESQWIRSWMPFTVLVGAGTLNAQIGILFLGWLSTDEQVAAMQVAGRGAMMVNLSLALVNIVISPYITRAFNQPDYGDLQKLSHHSARLALCIALPIALCLLFFSDPLVRACFGPQYVEIVSWPLRVLVLAQLVNVAFGSLGLFLSMTKFERDTLQGNTLALASNGVLCLIFIPVYGALGASVSAAIGLLVWNLFLGVRVYLRLRIRPGVV